MRRLAGGFTLGTVLLLAGACGGDATQPSADAEQIVDCDRLADEAAALVVAVADHAASGGGGLPAAALDAQHPDDLDAWDLAAALAKGSEELETRVAAASDAGARLECPAAPMHETIDGRVRDELVRRGQQLSERFDRTTHTAMNLMAVVAAAFDPVARSADVPAGFPAQFPVHPDAEPIEADLHDDGSVSATWQVNVQDGFEAVADYYLQALQEGRFGGWNVRRIEGSGTSGADGASTGRQRLEITGYDFAGDVEVVGEEAGRVVITAHLTPRN